MGCCASRPATTPANNDGAFDPPSVARLDASNSSLRSLNAPSSRQASVPSLRGSFMNLGRSQPVASSSSNAQTPQALRPNQKLIPIPAGRRSTLPNTHALSTTTKSRQRVKPLTDSSNQAWTRKRLEKERGDWWDTRVTGSREVWACLRFVVEALQQGDIATAQGLLNAQECTCPDGRLWSGVYDDKGILYKVPEWLVVEPDGLAEEGDMQESPLAEDDIDAAGAVDDDQPSEPDQEFYVRVRISSKPQDLRIKVWRRETIASIRERLRAQAQLDPDSMLRLVYGARIYADHENLETNGFWNYEKDYILSVFVAPKVSTST